MITVVCFLASIACVMFITYKFVEVYEYKHCLRCPYKKEDDIDFSIFEDEMKEDRRRFFNGK